MARYNKIGGGREKVHHVEKKEETKLKMMQLAEKRKKEAADKAQAEHDATQQT